MKWLLGLLFVLVSSAAWAQSAPGQIAGCVYNASPPSLSDKQSVALQCNSSGELITEGGGGGGGAVTIADGADVTEGALADAACATDNGTCSVNAVLKRVAQRLTTLIASLGGTASTAAAVPATAVYIAGGSDGGLSAGTAALTGLITCGNSVAISTASSGNTELVALTSGETVYVCGYMVVGAGAVDVQFIYGTGTACATGETDLTGAMSIAGAGGGMAESSAFWRGMKGAASNAFCIELSAAVQVSGVLYYTKF